MTFPAVPPEGGLARQWSFPGATCRRSRAGTDIVVVHRPALPVVHVRWVFRGGRCAGEGGAPGAMKVLAASSRHGTERYDSVGMAKALDQLGAHLGSTVNDDVFVVSVSALSEHLPAALDLLDEVALRPSFSDAEVERERAKALDVLYHSQAHPEHLAAVWISRAIYGAHPYGGPTATVEGLERVTPEGLAALHASACNPGAAMLGVFGDVDAQAVADDLVERLDRVARPSPLEPPAALPPVVRPPRRLVAVDRPGSEQCTVVLAHTIFGRAHDDHDPLVLANHVLGALPASRLFMELRERRSLTYGVHSAVDLKCSGGDLACSLSCASDKATEAVEALFEQLEGMRAHPPEEAELEAARRYVTGSYPRRAGNIGGVAGRYTASWLHRLPHETWSRYIGDFEAIGSDRVHEVCRRWIEPDAASVVVVGPGEAAAAALAQLGPVEERAMDDHSYVFEPAARWHGC